MKEPLFNITWVHFSSCVPLTQLSSPIPLGYASEATLSLR
jgi:hypothetical protein